MARAHRPRVSTTRNVHPGTRAASGSARLRPRPGHIRWVVLATKRRTAKGFSVWTRLEAESVVDSATREPTAIRPKSVRQSRSISTGMADSTRRPARAFPGDDELGFVGSLCADNVDCETRTCIDSLCVPACTTDAQCLAGQVCADALLVGGAIARVCRFDSLEGIARTDRIALGTLTALGGAAGSRALAVPPDAVSVTLLGARGGDEPVHWVRASGRRHGHGLRRHRPSPVE